ncbi:MAG TPA: phosphatidylglycerophosphatase A [Bryobacteraceae bacterium]|nr:phosphatidylglycerophosphatase A [Bryobacteraceae bacterium]
MSDRLALLLATWFGCGYFPMGPGTAGSLGAILVAWMLHRGAGVPVYWFAGLGLLLFLPGVWAAGRTERIESRQDPGLVVVDEVVGQWITLGAASEFSTGPVLAAFVLFRLFDIWKPFPVRKLEALPGGWGIVSDDAAAGVYGALVLYLGYKFF